jgi:type I restriction enzyme S subunit
MKSDWVTCSLGEVIKFEYGKPLPPINRKSDGHYPVYGANGPIDRTDEYYYDKPSLIVGRKGSAGEINFTEKKFWPLDVTYFVTFDDRKFSLSFIYYLLKTLNLQKMAKGVKPGINRNDVYNIKISYPPLPEQRRIVAILDEAFAAIAKAKENTERNLQNVSELYESNLKKDFANSANIWDKKRLGDICEIVGGGTPSKSNRAFYTGEIPWATVRDMKNDIINDTEFKITKDAVKKSSTTIIPKNSIIIATRVGLGKVCLIEKETAINQDLKGIVLNKNNDISIKYIFYWFKSIAEKIISEGTGATVQGVKLPFIRNLEIPLPPYQDQEIIVAKLDTLTKETQLLNTKYKQKLADLDELKKSLLQKAFEGELTKA